MTTTTFGRCFDGVHIGELLNPRASTYLHVMPNVNVPPFNNNEFKTVDYYMSAGVVTEYVLRLSASSAEERQARVVGESWVVNLPEDQKMPQAQANQTFYEAWRHKLTTQTEIDVQRRVTYMNFNIGMTDTENIFGTGSNGVIDDRMKRCIEWVASRLYKEGMNEASPPPNQTWVACVQSLCHAIISYVKQGNISSAYCNKINQAMMTERSATVAINAQTISNIYSFYGHLVDNISARALFVKAADVIPQTLSLRLSLAIRQTAFRGLSTYVAITRAMQEFLDFPWVRLQALIPHDFNHFAIAVQTVGTDQFYGYKSDLGPARSTLYPSLGYAAIQLLQKINGEQSWSGYGGATKPTKNTPGIIMLVENYVARRAALVANANLPDMTDEMRAYISSLAPVGEMMNPLETLQRPQIVHLPELRAPPSPPAQPHPQ